MFNRFINREHSWLDFNERVLQEAEDETVPLIERLRFIGIFSNNLDEFFKVRYATIKKIAQSSKTGKKVLGGKVAIKLLEEITDRVIKLQSKSNTILDSIELGLKKENIYFINEKQVLPEHEDFLNEYFISMISPALVTVILNKKIQQDFTDNSAFLIVKMKLKESNENKNKKNEYALIEILNDLERFIVLPKNSDTQYVMLVDDIIRYNFNKIFSFFNYNSIEAHMIKITRDAQLDLEGHASKSYIDKIMESVEDRLINDPVRMVYDSSISKDTLKFIINKLDLNKNGSIIPGGRYHHRRDYMNFPSLDRKDLLYTELEPLTIPGLDLSLNIIDAISTKDYMINTPYHTFSYLIKFLREAALDPKVKKIKITIYRLSKSSQIVSALVNAAKNGKNVLVQIELQGRCDERANSKYAKLLEEQGVKLIFGIQNLKVHAKICVIERKSSDGLENFGFISTGNFNESTAKIYTDFTLFTSDKKIMNDISKVFKFFNANYKKFNFQHLKISPFDSQSFFTKMLKREINNAKKVFLHTLKLN